MRLPRRYFPAPLLVLIFLASGCATNRSLRPLGTDRLAVEVSVPAVWMKSANAAFPVANPIIGVRYGLSPAVDGHLRWHPAPVLRGVAALESGATWHWRPADGLRPGVHLVGDFFVATAPVYWADGLSASVRGATALKLLVHWEPWSWFWPYLVVDQGVVFEPLDYVPSTMVGGKLLLGERWSVDLEAGWGAMTDRDLDRSQPYLGPGGYGALWMGLGVSYRFAEEG